MLAQALGQLGMALNLSKCELYAPDGIAIPGNLQQVPRVLSHGDWSYLGAPLWPISNHTTQAAVARAIRVAECIEKFGQHAPLEAVELLRFTAGACRVIHLCQAAPPDEIMEDVLIPTRAAVIRALEGVLGCHLSEQQWTQASLPCRSGGLGFADPTVVCHAARLAALVKTTDTAIN